MPVFWVLAAIMPEDALLRNAVRTTQTVNSGINNPGFI